MLPGSVITEDSGGTDYMRG
jgi:hypothetical protein